MKKNLIMSRNFPYRFCDIRKKFCDISSHNDTILIDSRRIGFSSDKVVELSCALKMVRGSVSELYHRAAFPTDFPKGNRGLNIVVLELQSESINLGKMHLG